LGSIALAAVDKLSPSRWSEREGDGRGNDKEEGAVESIFGHRAKANRATGLFDTFSNTNKTNLSTLQCIHGFG